MRTILSLLLSFSLLTGIIRAAIVDNAVSSPVGEDSLSVTFFALDSIGSPVAVESLWVRVSGPSGTTVFFDSLDASDSRIGRSGAGARLSYVFRDLVSNLDGPGAAGGYSISLLAVDSNSLVTPRTASFQLAGVRLAETLAQVNDTVVVSGGVIDSNRTERGLSSGAGSFGVTVVAFDSAAGAVIPHARITVRNIEQTALLGLGVTDISGAAAFAIDAGSVLVAAGAAGYSFGSFDTLVVDSAELDTVFGVAFYPSPPPSADLCRVWGFLYGIDGAPEEGVSVSARLAAVSARYNSAVVSPYSISTTTDSTGLFELDLIPSDRLTPAGALYEITIRRSDGAVLRQRVTVPTESTWQLDW